MSRATSTLARQALTKAVEVRTKTNHDQRGPISIYDICSRLKVSVRFVDISMEGIYLNGPRPQIILSSLRPVPRRAYTCAHELGHHVFGHGSAIDELIEDSKGPVGFQPDEFLAQTFAGYLLMPKIGVERAILRRGYKFDSLDPTTAFAVACNFGVGYTTLLDHLYFSLSLISSAHREALRKVSLKQIRSAFLGTDTGDPFLVADDYWESPTIDVEVGTTILLPNGVQSQSTSVITPVGSTDGGTLFRATQPGIARIARTDGSWAAFARVSRRQYVGLSAYRHLEEDSDA